VDAPAAMAKTLSLSAVRGRMPTRFTFDPREVDDYVRKLDPRRELVYRLAIRGLCDRCRGDRAFKARTEELMARYKDDLGAVLADAGRQ
jgi:hypothetical protein